MFRISTLSFLLLTSCEDGDPDALSICHCYEDALKLEGKSLRTEIIACSQKRDDIKSKYKDDPDTMSLIKSDTQACMAPLEPILAQKSTETKKKVKSNTPNAKKIKKTKKSRGKQ